jgi:PAS domain S-box-containing protein
VIERVRERREVVLDAAEIEPGLAVVLDSMRDGIMLSDPRACVFYANPAAARLFGFGSAAEFRLATRAELARRVQLVDESGRDVPLDSVPQRFPDSARRAVVGIRIVATGEERWAEVDVASLTFNAQPPAVMTTYRDVTERMRSDTPLRASEARYKQLVEAMPDIAWTTDAAGLVTMVNQRWVEYVGAPRELGTALTADDSLHPDDRGTFAVRWLASLRTGDPLEVTSRIRGRDGAYRWHLLRAVAVRDQDGEIRSWTGTSTDIDTAKRAEEGLRMLDEATTRLDATLDLESTVEATAAIAVPSLGDWCFIDLVEPDGTIRRAAVTTAEHGREELAARLRKYPTDIAGASPVAIALREGRPTAMTDLPSETLDAIARADEHLALLREVAPRSAMALPLVARGRTLGAMLLVSTRSGRRYHDGDVGPAADLARHAALAISNAELYAAEQAARKLAEAAADRTERLRRTTRAVAAATTADEVMSIILGATCAATGARGGSIVLRDGDELVIALAQGLDSARVEKFRRFPVESPLPIARAFRDGQPVWLPDLDESRVAELVGSFPDLSHAAGCAVPIGPETAPVGALGLLFTESRVFTDDDRSFIVAHAALCGHALERVALSEGREDLLKRLEDQRARLETVLRQMPAGVLISDDAGALVLSNAEAAEIWREPASLPAADHPEYVASHPDGSLYTPAEWPLARALESGAMITGEAMRIQRFDGTIGWISVDAAPVRDRDRRIVAAVSTFTDVTDSREAQERQRFLADASALLASSLDYETTIQRLAALAVPTIADWCTVDLVGQGGGLDRLALAHVDPSRVELARELRRRLPPDPAAASGVSAVIRTGKPEIVTDLPPDAFDVIEDEEARRIALDLHIQSYMCVPLVAGGEVLGAMTFVGAESGRRYTEADLALAENLAARAAAAVQNARLFRDVSRYKRILDATLDAVFMFDPSSLRLSYVNQGAIDQLGYDAETLLATTPTMLAVDLDDEQLRLLLRPLVDDRMESRTVTLTFRHASGRRLPVEVLLQHVVLPGEAGRIVAIARDIDDRVQAQARLQRLAEAEHARAAELNAVIRAMGEGVVVCAVDGAITLANPAAEEFFPHAVSRTFSEIVRQFEDATAAPLLGTRGGPVELRLRGDAERWIEMSTYPVAARGAGARSAYDHGETIVLLRDVTAARQRQAIRDTFIGVLSHELRTPVTTIYAGSKVLARSGSVLDEAVRKSIFDDIHVEAERLHRLVEDVIALTRFGEEEAEIGDEPVLLQRLLPAVVRSEEVRWPGISFELHVAIGLPTVIADATYVEQVVRNLLSNAAKYGGADGHVQAVVEAQGDEVLVRILDDGPGFPTGEADKLFDLYYRSPSTAAAAGGAGIGLFVCARLIRAMGGRIWAAAKEGRGAEFGFSLRVMPED